MAKAQAGTGDISISAVKKRVAEMVKESNEEVRSKVIRQMGEEIVNSRVSLLVRASRHLDGLAEQRKKLYDNPDNIRYVKDGATLKKIGDYSCDTGKRILGLDDNMKTLKDAVNKCLDAENVKNDDYRSLSKVLTELGCSSGCKH